MASSCVMQRIHTPNVRRISHAKFKCSDHGERMRPIVNLQRLSRALNTEKLLRTAATSSLLEHTSADLKDRVRKPPGPVDLSCDTCSKYLMKRGLSHGERSCASLDASKSPPMTSIYLYTTASRERRLQLGASTDDGAVISPEGPSECTVPFVVRRGYSLQGIGIKPGAAVVATPLLPLAAP
ncbi:hypothetical protein PYCCODRAFT_990786 [Trametes coccinea BRFM310]|uniref:Uncharacterized protein n=1 Tax=Trametes coccinea (strain BRFM310) TaxID=1353009 RepID=A0A1Y2IF60_TRAC3|nr:hypothetical protein PYCCODRAFT_990786 [Trametes coccinea BRFM310]